MGIFSTLCENPDCKARIPTRTNFCAKCGWAGPNSTTVCGDCHKQVGRNSRFCWNCGADIAATAAPRVSGNRWVRAEEEFAVRVYPEDIDRSWLARRVTVEPGTFGVIEQNGRILDRVDEGAQTLETLVRMAPMSLHLVSAGDVLLRPTVRGLRDRNGAELDLTLQIVFQVNQDEYASFIRHFFSGHRRRVTVSMLEEALAFELQDVVRALTSSHALQDMYGNLAWRDQFEEGIRGAMALTLQRFGLNLVQLNFVSFGGDQYETIMQARGEVYMGNFAADMLAERAAIRRRTDELAARGRLDTSRRDRELSDEIAELNKQYGVKQVLRDTELEEAVAHARHEQELRARLRKLEVDDLDERVRREREERDRELKKVVVAHQNELDMTSLIARIRHTQSEDEYRREYDRLQHEHELAKARAASLERNQYIIAEARALAEAQIQKLEADRKRFELEQVSEDETLRRKMAYEAHLQSLKEAEHRLQMEENRLEQENLKIILQYKLDKTRIKADAETARHTSDERTAAVDAKARSEEKDKLIAALEKGQDRLAALAEGMVDKFTRCAQQPSIIFAGSGGPAAVGGAQQTAPCPKCHKPVPVEYAICPHCGMNITGR